jgi:hypothetical protein
MTKLFLSLLWAGLAVLVLISSRCSTTPQELIDLDGLRASGDDWTVRQDTLPDGGIIRLHHDKWLMYFLHWRPLTEKRAELSPEYVRHLMLNFWGEDMPFTLEDSVGHIQVAGHEAYLIDGTIYDGRIRSRFIVWNCPQTERQLVADCNINLARGTPPELFDLQTDITLTIDCHGQRTTQQHPVLSQEFRSEKYALSFNIPENWRTNEYLDTEWFPEGMTRTNGSLWTLLTDSEKYVELRWDDKQPDITQEVFRQYLERIESDSVAGETVMRLLEIKVDSIKAQRRCFTGEGKFLYSLKAGEREVRRPFVFRSFLWQYKSRTYFLLASIAALEEFWGMLVDLSPSEKRFDEFVEEELFSNIRVLDDECFR